MAARKFLIPAMMMLLKVLSATLLRGEQLASERDWQEVVRLEGNFWVLLPGKATTFKTREPLGDFGNAERYYCVAEIRRGDAVASFLVTSVQEPQAYLDNFTPAERIQKFSDATVDDCRKSYPDAEIMVHRETRNVQGYQATYWKVTITSPEKWLEVQTLSFYADSVFHSAEVLHYSKGPARAVTHAEVEKFFDSYKLLSENGIVGRRMGE